MEAIARLLYHVSLPLTRDDFYAVDLYAPLAHSPSLWYDKSRDQALIPPWGGPLSGVLPDSDLFGSLVSFC